MRVYLPQFDPDTPPLARTQVGVASVVVANAGVLTPGAAQQSQADSEEEAVLRASFGGMQGRGAIAYEQLRPAYVLGWRTAVENPAMRWEVVQRYLPARWQASQHEAALTWEQVQAAVHSGWKLAQTTALQVPPASLRAQQADALEELLHPLVREGLALANDVQELTDPAMASFPQQVLARHVRMLQDFAHELQGLTNSALAQRPQRLGWWLRQRSAWLRLQGRVQQWQYRDVMALCEQREQQLLCSYRSASAAAPSQLLRQVLQQQHHDLQRNMEKLCWVRTHWRG